MYRIKKKVKFIAINPVKGLKIVSIYKLRWIDSSYNVHITDKKSKLNSNIPFYSDEYMLEDIKIDKLNHMLDIKKELCEKHGYFVEIRWGF